MICIFDTLVALIAGLAIFPSVAHFDPSLLGNVAVVVFAYALVALCVVAYFAFFRNRDTGTNADEKLSGDYPV